MNPPSQDTVNALNVVEIAAMKEHIETLEGRLDRLVEERNKAMVWGLLALGTVVMTLVGLISSYLLKGIK